VANVADVAPVPGQTQAEPPARTSIRGLFAAGEVASTLALTLAVKLAQQGTQWFVQIGEEEAKAAKAAARVPDGLPSKAHMPKTKSPAKSGAARPVKKTSFQQIAKKAQEAGAAKGARR